MVSKAPAATPFKDDAALTTAVTTGTALPALSVRLAAAAPPTASCNWLEAAWPSVQVKLAWPRAWVRAAAGATFPPAEGVATICAPGYGRLLASVRRTTIGSGKGPAAVASWRAPERSGE